jgi:membrane protein
MQALLSRWADLRSFLEVRIWQPQYLRDRSPRGRFYAVLRVILIAGSGLIESKAASRAAALSFSTLLGVGPLLSIAVLIAGFALDSEDPDLASRTLHKLIRYAAPQLAYYENPPPGEPRVDRVAPPPTPAAGPINPELIKVINDIIAGSRNGAVGVLGALTLTIIVIQLFTSIETVFNEIWGVRRGRSWLMRIVFYWTILTLGSVLFFAAATGLSVGAMLNAFAERIPYGARLLPVLQLLLPGGSALLLVAILTVFYRTIPNTRVHWNAALVGALIVTALLILNNFLAFLYVKRVLLTGSLYGSLGLGLVVMSGLYVFWFFVLLGGTVSYAVQNVHFRNSQAIWNTLSEQLRERLSLVVLLTIGRRFDACAPASTAAELSETLKVPTQIVNESLNRLVQMDLVTPIPARAGDSDTDLRFQPSRPLSRITLGDFKRRDDELGDCSSAVSLTRLDPILQLYDERTAQVVEDASFATPLEQLFREFPEEDAPGPIAARPATAPAGAAPDLR